MTLPQVHYYLLKPTQQKNVLILDHNTISDAKI